MKNIYASCKQKVILYNNKRDQSLSQAIFFGMKKLIQTVFTIVILFLLNSFTVNSATIEVGGWGNKCTLKNAIIAANIDKDRGACPAGSGADTIKIIRDVTLSSIYDGGVGLPVVTSKIIIDGTGNTIKRKKGKDAQFFRILEVNESGDLTINNTKIIAGKVYGRSGGAISNLGILKIFNSIVSHNVARQKCNQDCYGNNGSIYNDGALTIENSLISDNEANGIENHGNLTVLNSTISGNSGAGLVDFGTSVISNSTISRNEGGLLKLGGNQLTLQRTIVSGNGTNVSPEIAVISGSVNTDDYNLLGDNSETNAEAFSGFSPGTTDITATSDGLIPTSLTNIFNFETILENGGFSKTHALKAGSPAIDSSPADDVCISLDQRGVSRQLDGDGDGVFSCDIGAVEFVPPLNIVDMNVYEREGEKEEVENLFDGNPDSLWDGNSSWIRIELNSPSLIRNLTIAYADIASKPRDHIDGPRRYRVSVDGNYLGKLSPRPTLIDEHLSLVLPDSTIGKTITVSPFRYKRGKRSKGVGEIYVSGYPVLIDEDDEKLKIVKIDTPVNVGRAQYLYDGDKTTFWRNDGNKNNAWFDIEIDGNHELTKLFVTRGNSWTNQQINVYVDYILMGSFDFDRQGTFSFPDEVFGTIVRLESDAEWSNSWFRVDEVEMRGKQDILEINECGDDISINSVSVSSQEERKDQLIDGNVFATSYWVSEGDNWFELSLDSERELKCLKLAPRRHREYSFDVYVDDELVSQYSTKRASSVALQNFELPPNTFGTKVRIESTSHYRFRMHEVKIQGN